MVAHRLANKRCEIDELMGRGYTIHTVYLPSQEWVIALGPRNQHMYNIRLTGAPTEGPLADGMFSRASRVRDRGVVCEWHVQDTAKEAPLPSGSQLWVPITFSDDF